MYKYKSTGKKNTHLQIVGSNFFYIISCCLQIVLTNPNLKNTDATLKLYRTMSYPMSHLQLHLDVLLLVKTDSRIAESPHTVNIFSQLFVAVSGTKACETRTIQGVPKKRKQLKIIYC